MSNWRKNREQGWGKDLYRDSEEGWIAGVSEGLANYSGLPAGLIRLGWFIAFLYLNMLAVFAYVVAWVLLEDQPSLSKKQRKKMKKAMREARQPEEDYQAMPESEILQRASRKAEAIEERLRRMETEVSSRKYRLRREFDQF